MTDPDPIPNPNPCLQGLMREVLGASGYLAWHTGLDTAIAQYDAQREQDGEHRRDVMVLAPSY